MWYLKSCNFKDHRKLAYTQPGHWSILFSTAYLAKQCLSKIFLAQASFSALSVHCQRLDLGPSVCRAGALLPNHTLSPVSMCKCCLNRSSSECAFFKPLDSLSSIKLCSCAWRFWSVESTNPGPIFSCPLNPIPDNSWEWVSCCVSQLELRWGLDKRKSFPSYCFFFLRCCCSSKGTAWALDGLLWSWSGVFSSPLTWRAESGCNMLALVCSGPKFLLVPHKGFAAVISGHRRILPQLFNIHWRFQRPERKPWTPNEANKGEDSPV